jgi:hypothetical protein
VQVNDAEHHKGLELLDQKPDREIPDHVLFKPIVNWQRPLLCIFSDNRNLTCRLGR